MTRPLSIHRRNALKAIVATLPALAIGRAFAQDRPATVRIGYQKSSTLITVLKTRGTLEQKLAPLGVKVSWHEFASGLPLLEALNVGSVDVSADVADTVPVFALAAGANLTYLAQEAPSPTAQAIVVKADSPIRSVADLKGKRVGFAKAAGVHYLLIAALEKSGLSFKDIQPAYLAPADGRAAFERDAIDAWVVWDPYFAIAQQHYGARVVADTADRRLASSSFYLANRDFATKYPAALAATLDEIGKLTVWSGQHRDELSALAAEATGIDVKTWSIAFDRAEYSFGPVTPAHVAAQQQLADNFQALGIIPRRINVADYVWQAPKG